MNPLASAATVPTTAVGKQPLFFFGTLLDHDVLARVLDRPVEPASLEPALLRGFRRECARGLGYPLLVPDVGASVEGRVLHRARASDIARINHYESGEYHAELHSVVAPSGSYEAWLYRGLDHLTATGEPWELTTWTTEHKEIFLLCCDSWMADFPS
jgi:gamma-glutamylcyclotransferase (GGCT)/AIG2-like uncharacterized protein YtfP